MEDRLRPGLQRQRHHRLRDPVRDRRHPQHPDPRRPASGSPPPAPAAGSTSPTTSDSRSCTGCPADPSRTPRWTAPSTPAAPLFALTRSIRLPHQLLGISNDLPARPDMLTASPPGQLPGCSCEQIHDEPAPSLHPHYRRFTATTSRSASAPRIGTQHLTVSAARRAPSHPPRLSAAGSIGTRLPTFRAAAADRARAAFMPDTTWPISGHPPGSSRRQLERPGFDVILLVSTRHQRFAHARLPDPHLTPHRRLFLIAHHDGLQPTQHEVV